MDLETAALSIDEFETSVVPGLLQTFDYAETILAPLRQNLPATQPAETVESRIQRQRILRDDSALIFHAAIDESVLHQVIGSREILQDQLVHIKKVAVESSNATIQVLPLATYVHSGLNGPFSILQFSEDLMPPAVYTEGQLGQLFEGDPREVEGTRSAFTHLSTGALSPEESLRLIDDRIRALSLKFKEKIMTELKIDRNALAWRIASRSGGGNCVEVAKSDNLIAFRNSKRPKGEMILYTQPEFAAFLDGAKKGEFDDLLD
ncbi:DUF397 domain-containing protein [Actinoplanes derwentensis]|uniref:DUF397 domain-containing protein n=1 Tax=Actinoplanes derwentensis TaxID=113562 RepID=UPI0022B256B3|nr:DUF397 domain-containing protein [Actinoplanes derwentensis]